MYDPNLAPMAQSQYCEDKGSPLFAPYTGLCFACMQNIYRPNHRPDGRITGITLERASKFWVTGCPHCGRSFCD